MYSIRIFDHEKEKEISTITFSSKKEANDHIKANCNKRGHDFFCKKNNSLEYCKNY